MGFRCSSLQIYKKNRRQVIDHRIPLYPMALPYFPSRHLDSPVLTTSREIFRTARSEYLDPKRASGSGPRKPPSDLRFESAHESRAFSLAWTTIDTAVRSVGSHVLDAALLDPQEYPLFFRRVSVRSASSVSVLHEAELTIKPIVEAHKAAIYRLTGLAGGPDPDFTLPPQAIHYHRVAAPYVAVLEAYQSARGAGRRDPCVISTRYGVNIMSGGMCFMSVEGDGEMDRWMSFEQLLLLQDSALMRKNASIALANVYPADKQLARLAEDTYRWQETCLIELGNEGYELLKSVESLTKAYLPRIARDPMAGSGDSFDAMMLKVDLKEAKARFQKPSTGRPPQSLAYRFQKSVLEEITHVYQAVEIFGLQKFSGHPLIDPVIGGKKSAEKARQVDRTSPEDAQHCRNAWARLFCQGFIKAHHRWPGMEFSEPGTRLETMYNNHDLHLSRWSVPHSDWTSARFRKEFDFEHFDNYLSLLDDKAVSLLRSEKHLTWDAGQPSTSTRLLLEVLSRESISMRDIVDKFSSRDVPHDWKIVSLYPKEREFKLEARMFSMMPLEPRMFFACHEANIAETILRYIPQITMVDDKVKVHRRFLEMTTPSTIPTLLPLLIELDLSSWNLLWRALVVELIGSDLNDLFGIDGVFDSVHWFFEQCQIMVRVQGVRPTGAEQDPIPESPLAWTGHLGGFEGIAQKLWSICTVAMIETALQDTSYDYTLTDQGDNIVASFIIPALATADHGAILRNTADDITARCSLAAIKVNQELKPEECLAASRVVTYSKAVYVNGVDYPTSAKFLSRLFPSSALDFPSLGAYVGAIFSGAYAASASCRRPEMCYRIALYHTAELMLGIDSFGGVYSHAFKKVCPMLTADIVRWVLLCPSEFGGLPVLGPYHFMYGGGGDPLSKSAAGLYLLQPYLRVVRSIIGAAQSAELYARQPRIDQIISDPYSLPLRRPTAPADAVADAMLDVVSSITRNRVVSELLRSANEEYRTALLDAIGTLKPFNPLVARDLYDCSPLGTIDTIQRMFLRTRSIQTALRLSGAGSTFSTLIEAGVKEINHVLTQYRWYHYREGQIMSVYAFVTECRERWGPTVPIPEGITSYLPLEFEISWDPVVRRPGMYVELSTGGADIFDVRGRNRHYLGSATTTKRSEHGYKIVGKGHAFSAMRSLQEILSWSEYDPSLGRLIDSISLARSSIQLTKYQGLLSGIIGGDVGHRYAARIGERAAVILGQSNSASHCTFSTDDIPGISASTIDYPVMLQEFILAGICWCVARWDRQDSKSLHTLFIGLSSKGLKPLPPGRLSLDECPPLPPFPAGLAIVSDSRIRLENPGGPTWGASFPYRESPPNHIGYASMTEDMLQAIRRASSVYSMISKDKISIRLSFGQAEVTGAGFEVVLTCAAHALLDLVQEHTRSPAVGPRFRSSTTVILKNIGHSLAAALYPLLVHPSVVLPRKIAILMLKKSLSYEHIVSPVDALVSLLSSRMISEYHSPNSRYYQTTIVAWGSGGKGATESALKVLLRRSAARALVCHSISEEDADFIVGSTLRRVAMKDAGSEAELLDAYRSTLTSYDKHRRGNDLVSQRAQEVAAWIITGVDQYRLAATTLSSADLTRQWRYRQAPLAPARQLIQKSGNITLGRIVFSSGAIDQPAPLTRADRAIIMMRQARGRPVSLGSNAFSIWHSIGREFSGERVLIIGSGLGGLAATCVINEAESVVGHDLREDLPSDILLMTYVPPLLSLYRKSWVFRQSEASFSTSGDWWDRVCSWALLSAHRDTTTVCIDIPSEKGRSVLALEPLITQGYKGRVIWRVVAQLPALYQACADLEAHGEVSWVVEKDRGGSLKEWLIGGYITKTTLSLVNAPYMVHGATNAVPVRERRCLSYLVMQIAALSGSPLLETPRETLLGVISDVRGVAGTEYSTTSYAQWTDLLTAIYAAEYTLIYQPEQQEAAIRLSYLTRSFTTNLLGGRPIQSSPNLLYLLTNICPRLSADLDTPL